jgi:hypothetical protein
MKYVRGLNEQHHCTNCLRGRYSKKLNKANPDLPTTPELILDERAVDSFEALYVCGVSRRGYPKANYPHNLHAAILPQVGAEGTFVFENWRLEVRNGVFLPIPDESHLPRRYRTLPSEYTTCRIFRWAVCFFENRHPGQPS